MHDNASPDPLRLWPFAEQYSDVLREGHHKQAPASGSPTLVWHLALWPRKPFGERKPSEPPKDDQAQAKAARLFGDYDREQLEFFRELSSFAKRLQDLGRVGDPAELAFDPVQLHDQPAAPDGRETHRFYVCKPQALAFTLWWQDGAGEKDDAGNIKRNQRQKVPQASDLRVRVSLQTHRDHATLSFFIDVAKSHDQAQFDDAEDIINKDPSQRRRKVMRGLQAVRRVAGEQVRQGFIDLNRIPERGVSGPDAEALLATADYCYDKVWTEFAGAFGFAQGAGPGMALHCGERFADFRGLVMSMSGLETEGGLKRRALREQVRADNAKSADGKETLHEEVQNYLRRPRRPDTPAFETGTIGFGPLSKFDEDANEGNAVLKSLWPFMRRITPWADYSDWVGCGIIGGRALYITALGSDALVTANEEYADRDNEVSARNLPKAEDAAPDPTRSLRYLVVTKGEPLREQVGRYIERINAIGTMRLFALRNITSIRNASVHLEVIGRMLDGTLQRWEQEHSEIQEAHNREVEEYKKRRRSPWLPALTTQAQQQRRAKEMADPRLFEINNAHIKRLTELIDDTQREVIGIAALLDQIGEGGSGRLLYAIRRAKYFAREFDRMYQTLAIRDIDGWINYKNFVDRSMRPAFEFIDSTGERLISIRERLQTITETIQTAALIVETQATRENTNALKEIVGAFVWLQSATVIGIAIWLYQMFLSGWAEQRFGAAGEAALDAIWGALVRLLAGPG